MSTMVNTELDDTESTSSNISENYIENATDNNVIQNSSSYAFKF